MSEDAALAMGIVSIKRVKPPRVSRLEGIKMGEQNAKQRPEGRCLCTCCVL
jgi:hypothetical protein